MNLNKEKDWELNNFNNIGYSTEYDNLLINKDIDNYFNNIIAKPIPQTNSSVIKSNYNLTKFYYDYIEHNLVFIVVLIGIIIFLIIRYYVKDFDTFNNDNKIENRKKLKLKQNEKILNKSKKLEIEKNKLINYKIKLDKEKQQILSIIDELSNINEYENSLYNDHLNNQYLNKDVNTLYSNNYSNNQVKYTNNNNNVYKNAHNNNHTNIIYDNDYTSNYYDIQNIQHDKSNVINGVYVEPPFV